LAGTAVVGVVALGADTTVVVVEVTEELVVVAL